jgi:hypothetical protein
LWKKNITFAAKKNEMATIFQTEFDSIYLTSMLPEEVEIESDQPSIEVAFYLNNLKVFASTYYPFNELVRVRDIRSILEAAMSLRNMTLANLKIVATEPVFNEPQVTYDENGNLHMTFDDATPDPITETLEGIKVVYSSFRTSDDSESFLSTHFLTTRKSALLPRSGFLSLSNYTKANAQGSNYALIYYSQQGADGVVFTYTSTFSKIQSNTERIVNKQLSHGYFKALVDQAVGTNSKILGAEYHIGNRQFNIFFTDEKPTEEFTFLNAFNMEETAYLYNTTSIKTEVDRSEAVCGHRTQFYDETVVVKHEVETAPLTYDEAKWLNQMLTSKLVKRPINDEESAEVLISDISSEVSDSDKELIRIKFSWKYADGNEWI